MDATSPTNRPICETPGCGLPIPIGGEGHPEICPKCIEEEEVDRRMAQTRTTPTAMLYLRPHDSLGTVLVILPKEGEVGTGVFLPVPHAARVALEKRGFKYEDVIRMEAIR